MSTTAPAPVVETPDTPAKDVALPGPTTNARCDADFAEAAVARVYTNAGPIDLCGHHLREHMAEFDARNMDVDDTREYVVAYTDTELVIDRYTLGD
jgi:hypothetical protein